MTWKERLQLQDLEPYRRFELTCLECGHVHYRDVASIYINAERGRLHLDEVEKKLRCNARGCGGNVRLMLIRNGDTSAFVGGLA